MSLIKEGIIDKLLLLFMKKDEKAIQRVVNKHPEIKQMEKDLRKRAEELGKHAKKSRDIIQKKYEGTPLEKYFRFED